MTTDPDPHLCDSVASGRAGSPMGGRDLGESQRERRGLRAEIDCWLARQDQALSGVLDVVLVCESRHPIEPRINPGLADVNHEDRLP
jgi:hypothetical protein